jgi:hypothetical protein
MEKKWTDKGNDPEDPYTLARLVASLSATTNAGGRKKPAAQLFCEVPEWAPVHLSVAMFRMIYSIER